MARKAAPSEVEPAPGSILQAEGGDRPRAAKAKKFRPPQGRLEQMPMYQKQALMAWLTTGGPHGQGITYAAAGARLMAEFGVKTSFQPLCRFFQRYTRTPMPAVHAALSPDGQTLTLRINLSLLAAQQR